MRASGVAAVVAACALAVAACGGNGREDAIDVAATWFDAVAERRGEDACKLMLPSAEEALRRRFVPKAGDGCAAAVIAYREILPDATVRKIRDGRLVTAEDNPEDTWGVFPEVEGAELDVILVKKSGDGWKVGSTTIGP